MIFWRNVFENLQLTITNLQLTITQHSENRAFGESQFAKM